MIPILTTYLAKALVSLYESNICIYKWFTYSFKTRNEYMMIMFNHLFNIVTRNTEMDLNQLAYW